MNFDTCLENGRNPLLSYICRLALCRHVSGSGFLISGLSHRADITNKRPSFILVDGQLVSFNFLVRHLSMVLGAWSVLFTFYIKIQWIHFPSGSNLFLASG